MPKPTRTRAKRQLLLACLLAVVTATVASCTTTTNGRATESPKPVSKSATPSASASASASATDPAASINFSDCSKLLNLNALDLSADRKKHLTFSCGKLTVPLDYTKSGGPTIGIQVLKVHDDRQTKKVGDLLMNPGGPGAAGLTLPLDLLSNFSDQMLASFDLIGFDPRGVELSNPIDCISNTQKDSLNALDPDVRTAAGFALAKQAETDVATACTAKYGAALADYNTEFTAMDMERLRIALGDPKLNYLGFSYGTELGAAYAHLYPTKIRVAVLDGAVDPTTDDLTSFANQLAGFEGAFDQFAADCATRPACAVMGNPRTVVTQLTKQANVTPIPSSKTGETRMATGGIVMTGVISALYDQSQWAPLGAALIKAQQGDSSGLFALADSYNERDADGSYSNIADANTAIGCNDSAPGPTDKQITATATSWATQYPLFGLWGASSLFYCQSWQPVRHELPLPTAVGSAPILVVGTIHDPATPYAGAGNLAKTLTTGVVLTWNGQGHTAYTKSDCIDTKVDAYLISGTVPPVGTVCPA